MPRLTLPPTDALTKEQAEVISEVISGRRGKVPGPMIGWLPNPELARRAQKLGELLRYETSLEPSLSELAILICARHWTSHYEWSMHKKIAIEAGLDPQTIDDIARCSPEPFVRNERERTLHELASTLLAKGKFDHLLYMQGIHLFGERGMADLVGILGYYCLVSLTLNAFEIGLPDHQVPEFQDGEEIGR